MQAITFVFCRIPCSFDLIIYLLSTVALDLLKEILSLELAEKISGRLLVYNRFSSPD